MLVQYSSAVPETHTWVAIGGYGPGSGRFGAIVAAVVALISVAIAVLARTRFARRIDTARTAALVAQAVGLTGMVLAVWHMARSAAGFSTGNGRAGAIVAAAIALTGMVLAASALARAHDRSNPDAEAASTPGYGKGNRVSPQARG
ncbi:DUF6223 family protein [Nocardia aurantiaca]|uniref:Uncharacterized protein n=1 Tax=Nocardia aurantiaca TaxID=2675850 RepID=A0A6I3L4R3_9NOCA|nr:DUF6223 family protein [Nocardia aurantiaca]MTE17342.1 hypothetical protein [Nocardia aurantiaca]